MRHAAAAPEEGWAGDDESRPLTKRGREVTLKVARWLAAIGARPDLVLTSPYVRAVQTAAIVAESAAGVDVPVLDERLVPGFGISELREMLEAHASAGALMLVGHESDFSVVIGELIGGGRVTMKKASVALVDIPGPPLASGRLVWLVTPSLLVE